MGSSEGVAKAGRTPLQAVHDDDLDGLLRDLGLLARFERGELTCKFSGDPVGRHNLHSFFPESGDVKFVCDKPECIAAVRLLLQEGKVSL